MLDEETSPTFFIGFIAQALALADHLFQHDDTMLLVSMHKVLL
jgi:hypothetical protein